MIEWNIMFDINLFISLCSQSEVVPPPPSFKIDFIEIKQKPFNVKTSDAGTHSQNFTQNLIELDDERTDGRTIGRRENSFKRKSESQSAELLTKMYVWIVINQCELKEGIRVGLKQYDLSNDRLNGYKPTMGKCQDSVSREELPLVHYSVREDSLLCACLKGMGVRKSHFKLATVIDNTEPEKDTNKNAYD